tara:strand:- start:14844 stop:15668 length:825 start_codon:yes stop_codon:yes gene_type:complete
MSEPKKWGHDELARDLAAVVNNNETMAWCDMQLGPAGSPRPDVFTLRKSYTRPEPTIYEIKVAKSDLQKDLAEGKSHKYFDFASRVYFCFPKGLADKADIPKCFGVRIRHENVWRTVRRAVVAETPTLSRNVYMKLLIDGVEREYRKMRHELAAGMRTEAEARRRLSDDYKKFLVDKGHAENTIKWLESQRELLQESKQKIEIEIKAIRERAGDELESIFGQRITGEIQLSIAIRELRRSLIPAHARDDASTAVKAAINQLENVSKLLEIEGKE